MKKKKFLMLAQILFFSFTLLVSSLSFCSEERTPTITSIRRINAKKSYPIEQNKNLNEYLEKNKTALRNCMLCLLPVGCCGILSGPFLWTPLCLYFSKPNSPAFWLPERRNLAVKIGQEIIGRNGSLTKEALTFIKKYE